MIRNPKMNKDKQKRLEMRITPNFKKKNNFGQNKVYTSDMTCYVEIIPLISLISLN